MPLSMRLIPVWVEEGEEKLEVEAKVGEAINLETD